MARRPVARPERVGRIELAGPPDAPGASAATAGTAGPGGRGGRCHFVLAGDGQARTGGDGYDRRIVAGLRALGWQVDTLPLAGAWPDPDAAARAAAQAAVEALPDGALVVADGLAFGALPELAARHAARLRWVALVHHPLHLETGLDAANAARLRADEAHALRSARRVVVTSRRSAGDVAALGVPPAIVDVVEPGTERPRPPAADAAAGVAPARPGPLQLLCVATLTPRKGHALLLEALAALADRDWRLHAVGSTTRDPATAARLAAASERPPLRGRVVWHGELDADALAARLHAADLFVLPSLHEGYGMAAAEALACGLPVLATQAGALADTVPDGAGLKVPPGDVAALRAALARLLDDAALRRRLAAGARAAGRRLPDWATQAARFGAVLEGVA